MIPGVNPAMQTDRYEFSMLQTFIEQGIENKRATFEVFSRRLPAGFRYGVFAGLGRLIPMIEGFSFSPADVSWLVNNGMVDMPTADYLSAYKFTGTVEAYREGEIFFPNSPVLTVTGTLGECILLETLILSVLNFDSAIASKAARMVSAAKGRPIIEMGSRRVNEDAALAAARAAYVAGFASTSNVAAGMAYGIPVVGTAAHASILAQESEAAAFAAQIKAHGVGTTLLVDTYDIQTGLVNAVAEAQRAGAKGPGAVRIDSGDLFSEAVKAREALDNMGATDTKIIVTGDLDEYVIKDLAHAPIDGYGVGTKLVSTPPMGFVYKLVEIEQGGLMKPVAKKAKDKVSVGGRKYPVREYTNGRVIGEGYYTEGPWGRVARGEVKQLNAPVILGGRVTSGGKDSLDSARWWASEARSTLPEGEQTVWPGEFGPYLTAENMGD